MLYETILRYLVDAQIFVDRKRHKLGIALSVFSAESQPASTWANTNMFCAGKFLMPSQKIYARQKLSKLISNKKKESASQTANTFSWAKLIQNHFFSRTANKKQSFFFCFLCSKQVFYEKFFLGFFLCCPRSNSGDENKTIWKKFVTNSSRVALTGTTTHAIRNRVGSSLVDRAVAPRKIFWQIVPAPTSVALHNNNDNNRRCERLSSRLFRTIDALRQLNLATMLPFLRRTRQQQDNFVQQFFSLHFLTAILLYKFSLFARKFYF